MPTIATQTHATLQTDRTLTITHEVATLTWTSRIEYGQLPRDMALLSSLDVVPAPLISLKIAFAKQGTRGEVKPLKGDERETIGASRLLRRMCSGGTGWEWSYYIGRQIDIDLNAERRGVVGKHDTSPCGFASLARTDRRVLTFLTVQCDPPTRQVKYILHPPYSPTPPSHPYGTLTSHTLLFSFPASTDLLSEAEDQASELWKAIQWCLLEGGKEIRRRMVGACAGGYFSFLNLRTEYIDSISSSLALILDRSPEEEKEKGLAAIENISIPPSEEPQSDFDRIKSKIAVSIRQSTRNKFLALDSVKTIETIKEELEAGDRARRAREEERRAPRQVGGDEEIILSDEEGAVEELEDAEEEVEDVNEEADEHFAGLEEGVKMSGRNEDEDDFFAPSAGPVSDGGIEITEFPDDEEKLQMEVDLNDELDEEFIAVIDAAEDSVPIKEEDNDFVELDVDGPTSPLKSQPSSLDPDDFCF